MAVPKLDPLCLSQVGERAGSFLPMFRGAVTLGSGPEFEVEVAEVEDALLIPMATPSLGGVEMKSDEEVLLEAASFAAIAATLPPPPALG